MPRSLSRELRSLGVNLDDINTQQPEEVTNSNNTQNTNNALTMTTQVNAQAVNPFHNAIDLSTDAGKKFFLAATKGLDNKYDGKASEILTFLQKVRDQGIKYGFASIGEQVPKDGEFVNFFENPGKLSIQDIKDYCDSFWQDASNEANVQECIQSNMFFHYLKNSITDNVAKELDPNKADWMRPGGGDGLPLLHYAWKCNSHGTRASAYVCKKSLNTVTTAEFSHNVSEANKWFEQQNSEILSAGETNNDCVWQLFNCYLSCPVEPFLQVINQEKSSYDKGKDMSPKELMMTALTSYNALNLEKRWITEDPKVVALATVIEQLQEATDTIALLAESNQGNGTKKKTFQDNKWKYEVPEDDDPKEKVVNGKTFWFCPHEHNDGKGMWALHKPEDHQSSVFQNRKKGTKSSGENNKSGSKLKLSKSLGGNVATALSALQGCLNE